jgi:signal peptidase II
VVRGGIEHHWPTFNVADIAICVGVGLMAVDMMVGKKQPKPLSKEPPPAEVETPEAPPPPAEPAAEK